MNFLRYKEFLTSIYIFFFSNCDLRPRERDLAYHLAKYNSYSILLDIFFLFHQEKSLLSLPSNRFFIENQ